MKSFSSWMICSSISLMRPRARRDLGAELAVLALELRIVALQRHVADDADQVLRVQLADALELLADQADLAFLRLALRRQPAHFFVDLRDALLQQVRAVPSLDWRATRTASALAGDGGRHLGFRRRAGQLLGNETTSALSRSAVRRACRAIKSIELRTDDAKIGARHGVVETERVDLAFLHPAAFA